MFFRNIMMFCFPDTQDLSELERGLEENRLKPVGPLEMMSRGFISPYGRDSEILSGRIGDFIWLSIGQESRLLPGSVVNDMLSKKLAEIEQKEGRKPGGRTRKRIKDEIIIDLIPKALVQPRRTDAIIDTKRGIVYVDSSSRKAAENVISEIRRAVGSFPALPLNAEIAPRSILTGWLAGEELPDGIGLGDECELRDPVDQGAVVKCQRQQLESDEIALHLETGKQVTRIALSLNDHVVFTLDEDLVLRKFKLLDGAIDKLEFSDSDGLRAELEARFALFVGEITEVWNVLQPALKISAIETDGQKPAPGRKTAFELAPGVNPDTLRNAHYEDAPARHKAAQDESAPDTTTSS